LLFVWLLGVRERGEWAREASHRNVHSVLYSSSFKLLVSHTARPLALVALALFALASFALLFKGLTGIASMQQILMLLILPLSFLTSFDLL